MFISIVLDGYVVSSNFYEERKRKLNVNFDSRICKFLY